MPATRLRPTPSGARFPVPAPPALAARNLQFLLRTPSRGLMRSLRTWHSIRCRRMNWTGTGIRFLEDGARSQGRN